MSGLRRIRPWVVPHRKYMYGALAGTLVSVSINLMVPLLTSRIIDQGIGNNDGAFVRDTVALMFVLVVSAMGVSVLTSALAVRFAFHTVTDLRRDIYRHAQGFSFANLDRVSSSEVLIRLTNDVQKVTRVLSMGLSYVAQAPLMIIGALLATFSIDPSLVKVLLVMLPVITAVVWFVLARTGVMYDAVQNRLDRLNSILQENIEGTEVVKAFVRQDHEIRRFDEVADDLADQSIRVNQLVAALLPTLVLISSLGIAAVLWIGGGAVIDGSLTQGELVAFISYVGMVTLPLMMLASIQPLIAAAGASMNRIMQVLEQEPATAESPNPVDLRLAERSLDIRFDDVSFCYSRTEDDAAVRGNALTGVTVCLPHGKMTAIIGATGSGKTTLVHLIPRLYDTSEGAVSIGGIDVRDASTESLRAVVGIALQEPDLFSGTVLENLRFGQPKATDHEVYRATRAAQAHDFISALPLGYDSIVEQGGANLSGGQRQRLSIARTLVMDPQILVLDDATSSVDLDTEAKIQGALTAKSNRTLVIVAQRISSAMSADQIIVLDEGAVSGVGTHNELLQSNLVYQQICRSQLGEALA